MSLRLGIDIGTSGVRTAVIAPDGSVLSMARAPHPPQTADAIDANLWWDAVQSCVAAQADALSEIGRNMVDISGIAVDGTSGSMVLVDATGVPVTHALMYNSSGFVAEAERIAALAPDPHITRGQSSALARAMRLASEAEGRAAHLCHQADFIAGCLTGCWGVSDYNNALKTGFDPESESWPGWIAQLIDRAMLPDVVAVGDPIGPVSEEVVRAFGMSPEARVYAGTTDSIAAFFACAPLELGAAVTSLGSTLAVKLLSDTRLDDPTIGLYSHRVGTFWLVGGASNTGGAVLAAHFSSQDLAELSAQIDLSKPTGLDFYPLNRPGERFPINDPHLAPRLEPRPQSDVVFLQAMYEGIARIEARCYAEIEARGGPAIGRLFSAGGGAQDETFTQIRARALGLVPSVAAHGEAAIGVARLIPV